MKITTFSNIPKFTRDGNFQQDMPIERLPAWIETEQKNGLQLCPDFQRGHVWTTAQQVAFIEYLLRHGKSGRTLYFNCPDYTRVVKTGSYQEFLCVDGLQRITAILKFLNNEIMAFGSFFCEFTDTLSMFEDTIVIKVNNLPSREAVLQWYIEMNSGGTPHSDDEIERVKDLLLQEKRKKF